MNVEDLEAYHKHLTDTYDKRSAHHDRSEWHRKTALQLVEEIPPKAGDYVLDIGTGTGSLAFHVASLVKPNGKVVGVDLSEGMLAQAISKLKKSGLENIDFVLGDMEHLNFPANCFDKMYCASTFFCALEPLATLRHWNNLLKPSGSLGFHALSETSFLWVSVARNVLEKYGFQYILNTPTGTIEKSRHLLKDAGFKKIDILKKESGYYIPLEQAKESWIKIDDFAPGQYPHPVSNVPAEILNKCQSEYETRIEQLNTKDGVWNDTTMYYIYAYK
jgi:ubiquinone/menaquinone biosynthesis C-methylase UbiE